MANKFTDAVFNAKLSGMIKVVLYTLAWRADNETGICWTSHKRLADDSGVGISTAKRSVEWLIKNKVISISGQRPSRNGPINEYTLNHQVLTALGSERTQFTENPVQPEPSTQFTENPPPSSERAGELIIGTHHEKTSDKLASFHADNFQTKPTNPDTLAKPLDIAEQKMYDWAKAQPYINPEGTFHGWSNFDGIPAFRKFCLASDSFHKQFKNAMKKSNSTRYGGNGSDIASEVPSSLLGTGNPAHAGGANFLTPKPPCKKGCGRPSHSIGICWECQIADSKRFPHIIPDVGDDLEQIEKMNAELEEEMTPVQQIDVDDPL